MLQRLLCLALSGAVAALGAAGPAQARKDDLWTGFYVGATAGLSWSDVSVQAHATPGAGPVVMPAADIAAVARTGWRSKNIVDFSGGLEGGYNRQVGRWLLGVESYLGVFDVDEGRTNTFQSLADPANTATTQTRVDTDWLWSLRPRVGYAVGPWLLFATGGVAASDVKVAMTYADTRTPPGAEAKSLSKLKTGWVAGLGAAYAFTPRRSVKAQWLYADLGQVKGVAAANDGFATFASRAKVHGHTMRFGLDVKF